MVVFLGEKTDNQCKGSKKLKWATIKDYLHISRCYNLQN